MNELTAGPSGENCRYDGGYEKAMGLQTKEHQRLVGGMVRERQAESQGVCHAAVAGTLDFATDKRCIHQRRSVWGPTNPPLVVGPKSYLQVSI